jgi:hypothetical protein
MREAKEGLLHVDEVSPTAQTVGNKLFPDGGVQTYRVQMQSATGAQVMIDVDAATGDEAAAKALVEYPGGKVAYVGPAPQKAKAEAEAE